MQNEETGKQREEVLKRRSFNPGPGFGWKKRGVEGGPGFWTVFKKQTQSRGIFGKIGGSGMVLNIFVFCFSGWPSFLRAKRRARGAFHHSLWVRWSSIQDRVGFCKG
ncbi:MAG: hypothetical protein PHX30_06460 [Candidatus Pacebacteria bacterium]|nr:hypothetical protein [Candidatus Paceibacterota bacterium]